MGILTPSPLYFEQVLGGQDDNDDGAIKLCPKCVGFSYLQKSRDKTESEIESTVNRKPNYAPFHGKLEFGSNVDVQPYRESILHVCLGKRQAEKMSPVPDIYVFVLIFLHAQL